MQMTKLNDGVAIPQIGFGTFQIPAGAETEKAVAFALSRGSCSSPSSSRTPTR